MKKMIHSSLLIAAVALISWVPAEKKVTNGINVSIDQFLLGRVTPVAFYNGFSVTVTTLPIVAVTYNWGTTVETNVARFIIRRVDAATSASVLFSVPAKTTALPRSYSLWDNTVITGHTYKYYVRAESPDGTQGTVSEPTEAIVPMVTLNQ